jgi:hypothetical protein
MSACLKVNRLGGPDRVGPEGPKHRGLTGIHLTGASGHSRGPVGAEPYCTVDASASVEFLPARDRRSSFVVRSYLRDEEYIVPIAESPNLGT